jgi:PAS domain S-box-containing protein
VDIFASQEDGGVNDKEDVGERLAMLDTLFAYGPMGFGFVDRQFRFTQVNARLAAINGAPVEAHLGHTVAEILGPTLWKDRLPLFERALAGEAVVEAVLPAPLTDRSFEERRVLASYYPVFVHAQVLGVAVVIRDVTEQAQAEAALHTSREEYRQLFDAHPQPMWVYELGTLAFLAVNDAAIRVYGYSRDEFLGMTIADIRPAEDRHALNASVQAPRVGTRTDGPWRHIRRDGSGLWAEVTASALDFHGKAARLVVAQDVTERLAMEGERREAAERQQTFLREVLSSVTEGKLLLSNSSAQLPRPLMPVDSPVALTREAGLWDLRRCAQEAARVAGHTDERQFDLITAASEAGMNAIVHGGGGTGWVSVGGNGTVQVRVEDHGTGITMENLPRATLSRGFTTAGTLGHGLKMMLETADRLSLKTGPDGTTVVLEMERDRPSPGWLV